MTLVWSHIGNDCKPWLSTVARDRCGYLRSDEHTWSPPHLSGQSCGCAIDNVGHSHCDTIKCVRNNLETCILDLGAGESDVSARIDGGASGWLC